MDRSKYSLWADGNISLRSETKTNERTEYYMVLDLNVRLESESLRGEGRVEVQIPKAAYDYFQKQLADSKAQSGRLRAEGGLEVAVHSDCIN